MSEDLLDFDVNGEIISVIKRHRANTATLAREIVMTGHQLDEAQTTIEALRAELEAAKAELQQARNELGAITRQREAAGRVLSEALTELRQAREALEIATEHIRDITKNGAWVIGDKYELEWIGDDDAIIYARKWLKQQEADDL